MERMGGGCIGMQLVERLRFGIVLVGLRPRSCVGRQDKSQLAVGLRVRIRRDVDSCSSCSKHCWRRRRWSCCGHWNRSRCACAR